MPKKSGIKYTRYTNKDRPAEIDPKVNTSLGLNSYTLTCRRRLSTAGGMDIQVKARTEAEAKHLLESGQVPSIGLGWRVVSIKPL